MKFNLESKMEFFDQSRKFVLKVGSNMVVSHTGKLNDSFIHHLAQEVSSLKQAGKQVYIVTSGAIALGKSQIPEFNQTLAQKQLAASLGWNSLVSSYETIFSSYGLPLGSFTISNSDLKDVSSKRNLRNFLEESQSQGITQLINENDAIATDEILFGDNDILAAHLTNEFLADALIIYSQSNGVFENYNTLQQEKLDVVYLSQKDQYVSPLSSIFGTGGMESKFQAGQLVSTSGAIVYIQGFTKGVLLKESFQKNQGTFLLDES